MTPDPRDLSSLLPLVAVEITPQAVASLSLEAKASLLVAQAGVRGASQLANIRFPTTVGYLANQTLGASLVADYTFFNGQMSAFVDTWGCSGFLSGCGLGSGAGGSSYSFTLFSWEPLAAAETRFFDSSPCVEVEEQRNPDFAQTAVRIVPGTKDERLLSGLNLFGGLEHFALAGCDATDPYPEVSLNIACAMKYYPHIAQFNNGPVTDPSTGKQYYYAIYTRSPNKKVNRAPITAWPG